MLMTMWSFIAPLILPTLFWYLLVTFVGFLILPRQWILWRYCHNVWYSIDQFVNASILFGDPDETISSRFGKLEEKDKEQKKTRCKICHWICLLLNRFDRNHCLKSIELDEGDKAIIT